MHHRPIRQMKKKVRGRGISGSSVSAGSSILQYNEIDIIVLEEDDEYFGNYWKETDFAELKLGILAKDVSGTG